MTIEVASPGGQYTVAGTGPYAVLWPYGTGAVQVIAVKAGVRTALVLGTDFTVSPAASDTVGDVTLSAPAAALYATGKVFLSRSSSPEQGWLGVLGAREKGLEAQLDILAMLAQETLQLMARTLRLDTAAAPFVPAPNAALIFDASLQPIAGPTASDIANAQGNAAAAQANAVATAADRVAAAVSAAAAALSATSVDVTANGNNTWGGNNTHIDNKPVIFGTNADVDERFIPHATLPKLLEQAVSALVRRVFHFDHVEFLNQAGNELMLSMLANGAVAAYFNGLKKAETDAAGLTVTGRLVETDRAAETWHIVSRIAGTYYLNNTGRLIRVKAIAAGSATPGTILLTVNTTAALNDIDADSLTGTGQRATVGADVPAGHFYMISVVGGVSILQVQELS